MLSEKEEQELTEDMLFLYEVEKDKARLFSGTEDEEKHIVANKGYCDICKEDLFSMLRHDYVECSCGASALDGGTSYVRIVGQTVPLTVYHNDDFERVRNEFYRGGYGKDSKGPWRYTFLKDMDNSYLEALLVYPQAPEWQKDLVRKEIFYRIQVEHQDFFNSLPKAGCDK